MAKRGRKPQSTKSLIFTKDFLITFLFGQYVLFHFIFATTHDWVRNVVIALGSSFLFLIAIILIIFISTKKIIGFNFK